MDYAISHAFIIPFASANKFIQNNKPKLGKITWKKIIHYIIVITIFSFKYFIYTMIFTYYFNIILYPKYT